MANNNQSQLPFNNNNALSPPQSNNALSLPRSNESSTTHSSDTFQRGAPNAVRDDMTPRPPSVGTSLSNSFALPEDIRLVVNCPSALIEYIKFIAIGPSALPDPNRIDANGGNRNLQFEAVAVRLGHFADQAPAAAQAARVPAIFVAAQAAGYAALVDPQALTHTALGVGQVILGVVQPAIHAALYATQADIDHWNALFRVASQAVIGFITHEPDYMDIDSITHEPDYMDIDSITHESDDMEIDSVINWPQEMDIDQDTDIDSITNRLQNMDINDVTNEHSDTQCDLLVFQQRECSKRKAGNKKDNSRKKPLAASPVIRPLTVTARRLRSSAQNMINRNALMTCCAKNTDSAQTNHFIPGQMPLPVFDLTTIVIPETGLGVTQTAVSGLWRRAKRRRKRSVAHQRRPRQ